MKRLATALGLVASLTVPVLFSPVAALAQGVGDLYWGVTGGAVFFSDNDINRNDLQFDPGFAVAGQLGYIFGSVRAEAEIGYSEADVDDLENSNADNATFSALRGTGSLYFDFVGFTQSNILPYVGAGFGFAGVGFEDDINDDEVVLTAHGEAGVSFAAATNFDIVFAYRYEWFDTNVGGVDDDITSHTIRAGIRFFR